MRHLPLFQVGVMAAVVVVLLAANIRSTALLEVEPTCYPPETSLQINAQAEVATIDVRSKVDDDFIAMALRGFTTYDATGCLVIVSTGTAGARQLVVMGDAKLPDAQRRRVLAAVERLVSGTSIASARIITRPRS